MRDFINSISLNEGWEIGELFQNLGSGTNWYTVSQDEIAKACSVLNIKDSARFGDAAFLLVHDNRPIMLAQIDNQTGKVGHSALQGGHQPDAGWSRYTLALEKKLSGEDRLEEEQAEEPSDDDAPVADKIGSLCETILSYADREDDAVVRLTLRKAVLEARNIADENSNRAVAILSEALKDIKH